MNYREILFEKRGQVGYITLNRPDKMNAFTPTMAFELIDVFDRTDTDDDIRAVIVTGAGRAFCAGADLSAGAGSFSPEVLKSPSKSGREAADGEESSGNPLWPILTDDRGRQAPADLGGAVVLRIYRSLKPVIAAINGAAVGVGITMTLPMDVRLCVDRSKIGFVFNRRGIAIDGAASWFLPRIVGIGRALEWVSTGRVFTAADALGAGLVSESLADPEQLMKRAELIASEIADNCAPVSVAVSKRLLWDALGDPDPTAGHARESAALMQRFMSADMRAGVEAFLAKSPPQFVDRVSTSDEVKRP